LEEHSYLRGLIDREFAKDGDLEEAISIILNSDGIQKSKELARHHSKLAVEHLECLPLTEYRTALAKLADYIVSRTY
jgi:all-trans-nonaprenyl-diphosphate synthase